MNKKLSITSVLLFALTLLGPISAKRDTKGKRHYSKSSTCNRLKSSTSCKRRKSCSWVRTYKRKSKSVRGYCRSRKASKRYTKTIKPSKTRMSKRCSGLRTKSCRANKVCTWKYRAKRGSKRRIGYCGVKSQKKRVYKKRKRK